MCVKTISAWSIGKLPNGKANIIFHPPARGKGEFLQLPCGQCIECRLERSRIWALRCMHEASLYEDNCFITLTFSDDNLDPLISLRKHTFQKFMKRLRKAIAPRKVRYFHAGEYGENFGRPHHHAILFNYDFPDKEFKVRRGQFDCFESPMLTKLWSDPDTGNPYGFHEITSVSFDTCAYVARYCVKKINGDAAYEHYKVIDESGTVRHREPEFCTMSRRPGIGLEWYEKYKHSDVWAHDKIHIRGDKYCTPPRYYGDKFNLTNPAEYETIKGKRLERIKGNPEFSFEKQRAREQIKKAQFALLKRNLK